MASLVNRLLAALAVGVVVLAGVTSPADAAVARHLTVKTSSTSVLVRAAVTFSGRLTHTPKGGRVLIQRKAGTRWTTARSTRTTSRGGAYRVKLTMPGTPATYSFRALAPKTSRLRQAASTVVRVRVRAVPVAPTIATTTLPDAVRDQVYSATLTATGDPAGTWTASPLPTGLSLDPATGDISGTPTVAGDTLVSVGFTQTSTGLSAPMKVLGLHVDGPVAPVILTSSLPDATQGVAYSEQLQVSGGVAGTWTATPLPAGLSVDPASGLVSGTPTAAGTTQVTIGFTQTSTGVAATSVQRSLTVGTVVPAFPVQVSAGATSSCRVTETHQLWCWGADGAGELGDGGPLTVDPPGVWAPQKIGTANDWDQVTVGGFGLITQAHACALRNATGYCWGNGSEGALGDGGFVTSTAPSAISGGLDWASLSAGSMNTCGVTLTGGLYCWGDDSFGQSAIGGTSADAPTRVGTDADWVQVSTGYTSSCAVKAQGTLWCWGFNSRGQLGTGNTDSQTTPTQVGTGTTWTQVSVGSGYACAVTSGGTLSCWGVSSYGELGNGVDANSSATDVLSPLQLGSGTTWASVAAGGGHTCAVTTAGTAWCWGEGTSGELGDGQGDGATTHHMSTPEQVGTSTDWTSISVGNDDTCGVLAGVVNCWGGNSKGKLGINASPNATPRVNVPTPVVG